MHERTAYDPESGQLLSANFMDYVLPRAEDLPDIEVDLLEVPCETSPIGVKGDGEAGAVDSPPAMMDALSTVGVQHIDMPDGLAWCGSGDPHRRCQGHPRC